MVKQKHWLINKKGIDWWHILIVIGIIAGIFLIPFREEALSIYDVNWYFIDREGQIIDPLESTALGGFGVTEQTHKLVIANIVGTTIMAHPPYGDGSVHGDGNAHSIVLEMPKSKVSLIHQSDCGQAASNDGVDVIVDDARTTLMMSGKEYLTDKIIIGPRTEPNCDWVWVSGFRQISLGEHLYKSFLEQKTALVPAGPFAVIEIGE